jgi:hypothetical protein
MAKVQMTNDETNRDYRPSVMLEGNPFSQLLGESHGRAERLSDSVVAQPLTLQAAATSSNAKNQYLTLAFFTFPLRVDGPCSGFLLLI